jgi:hypothetical protein
MFEQYYNFDIYNGIIWAIKQYIFKERIQNTKSCSKDFLGKTKTQLHIFLPLWRDYDFSILHSQLYFNNIYLQEIFKKNKCGHRNVLSKRQVWMSIFHIINWAIKQYIFKERIQNTKSCSRDFLGKTKTQLWIICSKTVRFYTLLWELLHFNVGQKIWNIYRYFIILKLFTNFQNI